MEPQTHGDEFPNEAVAHLAPASNRIPLDPDDDELLVVPAWESGTVVDAWAGVEPPTQEVVEVPRITEAKPLTEPVAEAVEEPMAGFPAPIEPEEDGSLGRRSPQQLVDPLMRQPEHVACVSHAQRQVAHERLDRFVDG